MKDNEHHPDKSIAELSGLLRGEARPPMDGADAAYWRQLLARQNAQAFEELPLDFPRSDNPKAESHCFEAHIDAAKAHSLRAVAREHQAGLHALMLTLLALEARRRTGRTDWVIGDYPSMLPVPCTLPLDITLGAAVRDIQRTLDAGVPHARYPFARICRDFEREHPGRHPARCPLFDLAVMECPASAAPLGQDMVLTHEDLAAGGLVLHWQVSASLYTRQTAQHWFEALTGWAAWLAEYHGRARETLPALLPQEAALLKSWEYGVSTARPALRFHELFERVLDAGDGQGERPAIIQPSGITTYASLERQANAMAHSLLQQGVAPGRVVGVLTGRSAHLPAAVLAIWKAGATYLPLSADLPPERLDFMARDTAMAHWIALDGLAVPPALGRNLPAPLRPELFAPGFRSAHAHRPPPHGAAGSAAYIIYTSGSTGQPKGALISHQAYVNTVLGEGETIGLTRHDRSLMFSSPSFDVSLSDMGLPLAFGGALCPVPTEVLSSPVRFQQFLAELQVTVADITPTYLRLFEGAALPSVRILITGGEAPFPADVQTYAGRCQYFNAYGPTENTITSTMQRLAPNGAILAGRPLPNTSVHICDAEGRPVPPGVVGELWLGGAGLARHYVGRPDLTAAAFVETPRGRCYRSGDLGRWRATGELEILGRIDDQVKLNGIRIELGEIEHALSAHPDIAQAVAVLDSGAERTQSLWAFVRPVSGKPAPAEETWRDYLAGHLPAYMIPASVIAIPSIPLTHSGKVDKAALRGLLVERSTRVSDALPLAGLETQIALVWAELLRDVPGGVIHRDDNFFNLGGHSLLAIAAVHRLQKALGYPIPVRELFAEPTLRGFAERVGGLKKTALPARILSDRATLAQQEFHVGQQAGVDTRVFNLALTLLVCGQAPPEEQWRRAWAEIVARHDALRTGFHEDAEGVLRRSVRPLVEAELEITARRDMAAALSHARERQRVPFTMENPPLWRAGLVSVAGRNEPVFWLALHHAVGDGVSLGVLAEELSARLRDETLPPLTGHFDESAGREEAYLAAPACAEDAGYWRKTLGGLGDGASDAPQPFDEWPLDSPRPSVRSAGSAHSFLLGLDAATASGLRELAQRNGVSLHVLMLAIMAHETRRRTGRPEFLLGTAASTRASAEEARTVGCYVNLLPVPCRVQVRESFESLLRATQRALAEGLQHARYPFARMHRDFQHDHAVASCPGRYPLLDFLVTENPAVLEDTRDESQFHFRSAAAPGGDTCRYELRTVAPPQDMVLVHEGQPGGSLALQWIVNAAIYEKETAEAWMVSLAGWARYLAGTSRVAGSPLPALLPEEEDLLAAWEQGAVLPHPSPSVATQFEHWARTQPERPALITEEGAQSYARLNARSNGLAHALLALGVAPGETVGVLTDRSSGLPEMVLAIWKARGCYLPLVTDLPAERLAFLAREAGVRVLVVLDRIEAPAALTDPGCTIFRPETVSEAFLAGHEHAAGDTRGSDLACILYTSGSTGVPKGVMLLHQGVNNLGLGAASALGIRADDRVMLLASPAFDAWISDLAMAFATGAAVVPILRSEMNDVAGMRDKIARLGITTATMTPSYLRLFEQAEFPGLRVLMTVGEPPHMADAMHYAARLRYFNGYGPTECSAAVSYGEVRAGEKCVTAGRPLVNTFVQIRGTHGEAVPPGATGEICVGGIGVAPGYLNRPDLTAAGFVETPAGRMYRTGDSGRWTRRGELQVLGRTDSQVKLRGQRVELGEIEHRLEDYPGVRQAVAAVDSQADGTQTLLAFVCLDAGAAEPTQAEWHEYLSANLPSYLRPAAVFNLPAIPMNINGKVDRAALLRAAADNRQDQKHGTQPHAGLERQIAEVWAEHLKCGLVAREDSFFDLGGDSLRAISVVSQLRRTVKCDINHLYEHPRLADFAATCRQRPEHLRGLLQSAAVDWRNYRRGLADYERERDADLAAATQVYEALNQSQRPVSLAQRRDYRRVLLTGATGYLGSYLLRELLCDGERHVTALVRGADDATARARLGETLCHYFGAEQGIAMRDHQRLTVLAGDLRRDGLGLSPGDHRRLANELQAVVHCAANVKHFGHYSEFHADNVAATARLLQLAGTRAATPADFHFVSTLSVSGKPPETGFRLFTEYDTVPDVLDENYYTRSKQEAERLVVAARGTLANACIHRVGNLVFAAEGGPLQVNIAENAFFQLIGAFQRLGAVPDDPHVWLCHVDVVARAVVRLASAAGLTNQTHHLENARMDLLAAFVGGAEGVRSCDFGSFLERLEAVVDDPEMDRALAVALEAFGLYRGLAPQPRARRLEIVSGRTQTLLAGLAVVWPEVPEEGRAEMLRQASRLFSLPAGDAASQGAASGTA